MKPIRELVSEIVIKTGGILSLFGQQSGQNVKIATFNAVGAIRGTTTYFAWQEKKSRPCALLLLWRR